MTMLTSDIHGLRREITHKSSLGNLKSSKLRGKLKLEIQYGQDQEAEGSLCMPTSVKYIGLKIHNN